MRNAPTVLVVEDNDDVGDLIALLVQKALPTAVLLRARTGLSAVELFQAQQPAIQLVILDIQLGGALSGREVCLKIRELDPAVPILPCTVDIQAAPFLTDLGCAPLFAKPALAANPLAFVASVRQALETPPEVRVSSASLAYMLGRADAMLADLEASDQPRVIVLCQHPFLRTALGRALTGLHIHLLASVGSAEELCFATAQLVRAQALIGTVGDIGELRSIALATRLPVVAVAMRQPELDALSSTAARTVNIVLVDEYGDATILLEALRALQRHERFLALPAVTIARWVAPPGGLTVREWEIVIASIGRTDQHDIAAVCGVDPGTVETYWKRVRRRLGGSRQDLLDLASQTIAQSLGALPRIVSGTQRDRSVGQL